MPVTVAWKYVLNSFVTVYKQVRKMAFFSRSNLYLPFLIINDHLLNYWSELLNYYRLHLSGLLRSYIVVQYYIIINIL